jgi:hypothetical protein
MMYDWGPGWGGMLFGPLFMAALVAVSIVVIGALVRSVSIDRPTPGDRVPSPGEKTP